MLQLKAVTAVFFEAGRYKCFPSDQAAPLTAGFHPLSSRELVPIPTDVTEAIDPPGISKLLLLTCLTVLAQARFSYPMGNAG